MNDEKFMEICTKLHRPLQMRWLMRCALLREAVIWKKEARRRGTGFVFGDRAGPTNTALNLAIMDRMLAAADAVWTKAVRDAYGEDMTITYTRMPSEDRHGNAIFVVDGWCELGNGEVYTTDIEL